jgi:hypothetical protein
MRKSRPSSRLPQSRPSGMELGSAGDIPTEPDIDLTSLITIPEEVVRAGIVDQNNFHVILHAIAKIELTVDAHRSLVNPNFHKFLSFCLNLLELQVQSSPGGVKSMSLPHSDPASSLSPVHLAIKLRPRESIELKSRFPINKTVSNCKCHCKIFFQVKSLFRVYLQILTFILDLTKPDFFN